MVDQVFAERPRKDGKIPRTLRDGRNPVDQTQFNTLINSSHTQDVEALSSV